VIKTCTDNAVQHTQKYYVRCDTYRIRQAPAVTWPLISRLDQASRDAATDVEQAKIRVYEQSSLFLD